MTLFRFRRHDASRIVAIGIGYTRLPRALGLASVGFGVVCPDRVSDKLDEVRAGRSYLSEPARSAVAEASSRLVPTGNPDELARLGATVACVPAAPREEIPRNPLPYAASLLDCRHRVQAGDGVVRL